MNRRLLEIITPINSEIPLLIRCVGVEALSKPFQFSLTLLVINKPNAALLLGQSISWKINSIQQQCRTFNGYVHSIIEHGKRERGRFLIQLHVRPALSYLQKTVDYRQFTNLTAIDIIELLLNEFILQDYQILLTGHDAHKMTYSAQYAENTLHYIHRLIDTIGAHYFFKHSDKNHTLVFQHNDTLVSSAQQLDLQNLISMDSCAAHCQGLNSNSLIEVGKHLINKHLVTAVHHRAQDFSELGSRSSQHELSQQTQYYYNAYYAGNHQQKAVPSTTAPRIFGVQTARVASISNNNIVYPWDIREKNRAKIQASRLVPTFDEKNNWHFPVQNGQTALLYFAQHNIAKPIILATLYHKPLDIPFSYNNQMDQSGFYGENSLILTDVSAATLEHSPSNLNPSINTQKISLNSTHSIHFQSKDSFHLYSNKSMTQQSNTGNMRINSNRNIDITAKSMTLQTGASCITLNSNGINIETHQVHINTANGPSSISATIIGQKCIHGGAITSGSQNVTFDGTGAARVTDAIACLKPSCTKLQTGNHHLLINGKPAAHAQSLTNNQASLQPEQSTVHIGSINGNSTTKTKPALNTAQLYIHCHIIDGAQPCQWPTHCELENFSDTLDATIEQNTAFFHTINPAHLGDIIECHIS